MKQLYIIILVLSFFAHFIYCNIPHNKNKQHGLVIQIIQDNSNTGYCMNDNDITIRNTLSSDQFNSIVSDCAHTCFGDTTQSTDCIQQQTKLSLQCSECYGNDVGCMSNNCMTQCMFDDKSNDCLQCHTDHCLNQLIQCTGITDKLTIAVQ